MLGSQKMTITIKNLVVLKHRRYSCMLDLSALSADEFTVQPCTGASWINNPAGGP